jgi:L-aminopeptidase/D-esterase-like protein
MRTVTMGAWIVAALMSFEGIPEGPVKKSPAHVVQTFRSARHGRPDQPPLKPRRSAEALAKAEGLHCKNPFTRAGGMAAAPSAAASNTTLTAVPGIKVGHHTLTERPTGCTVILAEAGATAGVDVRGAAPATRETDLLNPVDVVQEIHAIVLSGGSAFGLDAASGVMKYLEARGIGFPFGGARVPTVPGASLFDFPVGNPRIRPTADCGDRAARAATDRPVTEGSVGAGAGATIGKTAGLDRAMKAGIGSAAIQLPDGLIVAALVAVNAAGDVIDPATGRVVAGVRAADGQAFADARVLLRTAPPRTRPGENTTLGVVATNAALTKTQATRVAQMAHDGFARAIAPAHTAVDGDVVFALATRTRTGDVDVSHIGALAADVMAEAIVRAARQATGVPGFPAVRDLRR